MSHLILILLLLLLWFWSTVSDSKVLQPSVYLEGLPKTVLSLFTKRPSGTLKDLSSQDINLNSIDSKLVSSLMPFQKHGVCFSIRRDGRVLIADDMGLGKTIQAICVASYYRKEWPVLVICPSSMRLSWQQVSSSIHMKWYFIYFLSYLCELSYTDWLITVCQEDDMHVHTVLPPSWTSDQWKEGTVELQHLPLPNIFLSKASYLIYCLFFKSVNVSNVNSNPPPPTL